MIELAPAGGRVLFTDRSVDLRAEPERFGPVRRGRQVHGARVVRDSERIEEADGQVVTDSVHGALVLTADCLPIALVAHDAVAMLHGGWRGLAAGIVAAGVAELEGPVAAVLGPSARGCCYEVGEEVQAVFAAYDARIGERNLALERVAEAQLRAAGVERIDDTGVCTICDERYFSYRREGAAAGRQGGIAWRA
jgi:purine-nucleoside/S-methyl-5'-thioadenosine phosphorylase / adenosine deaminase